VALYQAGTDVVVVHPGGALAADHPPRSPANSSQRLTASALAAAGTTTSTASPSAPSGSSSPTRMHTTTTAPALLQLLSANSADCRDASSLPSPACNPTIRLRWLLLPA